MSQLSRHHQRKRALNELSSLFDGGYRLRFIHYSCESFYDRETSESPRITSIAVLDYRTRQAASFSIHQVAERRGSLDQIEAEYDCIERVMLDEFYVYVKASDDGTKWFHWNMNDSTYGFSALEHRYRVLGGDPEPINRDDRVSLASLLKGIYGYRYVQHPRLKSLVELNDLSHRNYLTGAEEAAAFEEREYVRLHMSTLAKVDLLAEIAQLAEARALKTRADWRDVHGLSVAGAYDRLTESSPWKVAVVFAVPFGILGTLFGVAAVLG